MLSHASWIRNIIRGGKVKIDYGAGDCDDGDQDGNGDDDDEHAMDLDSDMVSAFLSRFENFSKNNTIYVFMSIQYFLLSMIKFFTIYTLFKSTINIKTMNMKHINTIFLKSERERE